MFGRATIAGLVAGTLLGLLFKLIEAKTGIANYTLLLNIDYFPYLKEFAFPESAEFSFHLIVSILLSIVIFLLIERFHWTKQQRVVRTVVICLLIGAVIYPTTALSERTPPVTSTLAIAFWLIGHILYGFILSIFALKSAND